MLDDKSTEAVRRQMATIRRASHTISAVPTSTVVVAQARAEVHQAVDELGQLLSAREIELENCATGVPPTWIQKLVAWPIALIILFGWMLPLWLLRDQAAADAWTGVLVFGWSFGSLSLFHSARERGWLPSWL